MKKPTPALKRSPQQARSQEALDRVLRATLQLLETSNFEDLTLGRILGRAKVSVGSFYARFHSKEDLLPLLYASYSGDLAERMKDWLAPQRWRGKRLEQRIHEMVHLAVASYRERRGLLRAVSLLARSRPREVARSAMRERAEQYEAAAMLLQQCRAEIRHPDPDRAIQVGLLFTLAACRDKILFSEAPQPASVNVTDRQLADELARALHAYLTTHPDSRS